MELTPQEAKELLEYITGIVIGSDPEFPTEAFNKLAAISEQEN